MLDFRISSINSALRRVLIRFHCPLELMLTCVRWYVAYPLSLRHVEEMMEERGVFVDHITMHRLAIKMLSVLAAVFRRRKRPVGLSWRVDETYIKVSGQCTYLYRAVEPARAIPLTFCSPPHAIWPRHGGFWGVPSTCTTCLEKITLEKSGANTAAIESIKADACVDILMRQNKYLNNIVEQDHRAIKQITRRMLGFKSSWSAQIVIARIETMHMIRKGQLDCPAGPTASAADQFYGPAF